MEDVPRGGLSPAGIVHRIRKVAVQGCEGEAGILQVCPGALLGDLGEDGPSNVELGSQIRHLSSIHSILHSIIT